LRHGMPMERLNPRPDFQEENRQALNAEDSLLAVLGTFSRLTKQISNISFPLPDAFGALLARLRGQRTDASNPMSFHCLSYLDLSDCTLRFRDFYNANLEGSNLVGANLYEANFGEANLVGANLERANLERANLRNANLKNTNLEGANLEGAILNRAKPKGANRKHTILENRPIN